LLKGAYTYAQRDDTALPAGAQPMQLILDAARARTLVIDAAHNQLLVYGPGTRGLLQSIPTGPNPQALTLTPDGSRLLLTTAGDYKISVLDADTYTTLEQAALPATIPDVFGNSSPVGPPVGVVALAGNKAVVKSKAGYLQVNGGAYSQPLLFDYDLSANTVTQDVLGTYGFSEDFLVAASADGEYALFGSILRQVASGANLNPDTNVYFYGDVALSASGSITLVDATVLDSSARWQTSLEAPSPIPNPPFEESYFSGMQTNASGSLLFRPAADHVRIFDTSHGILARTVEVPDGVTGSQTQRLLAVDPQGQKFITITAAGISTFTFAADPLTVNSAAIAGSQLTVSGSGFQPGATVKIDLEETPCTVASSLRITASLTALASGEHSVTVTNPDGHVYTLSMAFREP
jgi:DNA-binding beta-propeller fold protein YncE